MATPSLQYAGSSWRFLVEFWRCGLGTAIGLAERRRPSRGPSQVTGSPKEDIGLVKGLFCESVGQAGAALDGLR